MKFFLAPMQGLTGYTVRNAFHHHFDYIDNTTHRSSLPQSA